MNILQRGKVSADTLTYRKKRVMSAAVRAQLPKKAKERWARDQGGEEQDI
jgi:hypothetical protein